jgi:hypothetical protein
LPLMDLAAFIVQMVTQKIVKQDCVCHVLIKEPVIFVCLSTYCSYIENYHGSCLSL